MITVFRRKLKSKAARNGFLWIILIALGGGFIFGPKLFRQGQQSNWVAKVNGYEIPYLNYSLKVQENDSIINYFRSQYGEYANYLLKSMGMNLDPKTLAFEQVVQQELLNQEAKRLSISLDAEFVSSKIYDPDFISKEFAFLVPQGVIDSRLGANLYVLQQYLAKRGVSIEGFEDLVEQAIRREIVLDISSGAAYVPEFEIMQKYILDYLARKFSVIRFDFDSFLKIAKKEEITKQELTKFYDEQNSIAKRYFVPEKRSGIAYIFDADSYGINVDEKEIKNYYDDNKMKFFVETPTKIQVRRILFALDGATDKDMVLNKANNIRTELLLDPSSFAQKATELSEDKASAKDGGLIPFFSKGERDRNFEKTSFLLKEDGEISEVIKTKDGIEIVQRVSRKNAEFKPLEKVSKEIKDTIKKKKFKILFAKDMDEVLRKSEFDKKKFEDLVSKTKKEETVELRVKGIDKKSESLFRAKIDIPTFYVEDDTGIVLKLTKIEEYHLPSLETIEATVKNDLYEKKASKKLDAILKEALKEAKTKKLDEISSTYAKDYSVNFDQTGWIKQNDIEKVNALRGKGYPVEKMLKIEKVGFVADYRGTDQETADGYLVKVDEIEKFNDKEYQNKREEIKKGISRDRDIGVNEEFIAFLRKKATIKTNKEIIR